jgi:ketosteroid isomerase-like protein
VVLAVLAGLGIAAVLVTRNIARKYDETERRNNSNANTNARSSNSNLGSNSNSNSANSNENGNHNLNADDSTPPPTDAAQVLSELTDLEHEWTMANINADKKKLGRILADDYVETTPGRPRGKAEYLNTIKRDTSIQRWNFEELKVDLKSDRATLTGTIRMDINDEQGELHALAFVFTDKFVWRDGRWQATGSEVNPLKE